MIERNRKSIKVVYWNNMPAPYMVDRFNALAKRGSFDFEVWFNERVGGGRSWNVDERSWLFKYQYVPAIKILGKNLHFVVPLLLNRRPNVLVSLYAQPSFLLGWFVARLCKIKTAFRVLMTNDRWVRRLWIKEQLKHFLFSRVDAIETPGEDGAKFAIRYGASRKKVFLATHTVDSGFMRRAINVLPEERVRLRNRLNLVGTVFLYVGRLWSGKGVQYLLEAFCMVEQQAMGKVSLLLLGDGPDELAYREYCHTRNIANVIFGGYKQKEELPIYFAAADVFVFPTLGDPYGIVVDEAMACSLPVISTSAAGEIRARVRDGLNGYLVDPENSEALAAAMLKLANDAVLRKDMGQKSRQLVVNHTPERWAEDFEKMIFSLVHKSHAVLGDGEHN